MSGRYRVHVDADRGHSPVGTKAAELMGEPEAADRSTTRAGYRDLDKTVEGSAATRAKKDRDRAVPRPTTAGLGHVRKQRKLPRQGERRRPLSSRQKKERSKARHRARDQMRKTEFLAHRRLVRDASTWHRVNDSLSEATGDVQHLSEEDRVFCQRADRAIQRYERQNDRGHVVYANVKMPAAVNQGNIEGFSRNNFQAGDEVTFDRYTLATHQMHEATRIAHGDPVGQTAVFEIQTRRGAYLGRSDSRDNTPHLLPRGTRYEVVGSHWAVAEDLDGRASKRLVIQLQDIDDD